MYAEDVVTRRCFERKGGVHADTQGTAGGVPPFFRLRGFEAVEPVARVTMHLTLTTQHVR